MKANIGFWQNTVECDRYNNLSIIFSKVADRAVKSELAFNDIKQLLVIQLEILKNLEVEPKSPATNECKEGEEKDSPQEEIADNVVDDTVLNPKEKTRRGRRRSNTFKSTWKYNKKSHIPSTDGNACNEKDGHVVVDVPAPLTKKRGRPLGSKNKNETTTNLNGDRNMQVVQQQESTEVAPPSHMYQPTGVAPPFHMYQVST
ncbi:hypothetical protein MKX01_037566 [Papaver californicum]|nr:hypothetical protein MKX01_037566 [Papaver californicum]